MQQAERLISKIENEEKLDGLAQKVSEAAERELKHVPNRDKVLDFLHGVWLGHPLHPLLATLPLGAWSLAAILDTITLGQARRSTTFLIGAGIVSAMFAAPAGLADWLHLSDRQRRVGLVHAGLNTLALPFFIMSFLQRLAGGSGYRNTIVGVMIGTVSAYLGGHLVYRMQAGVAKTAENSAPQAAGLTVKAADILEGSKRRQEVDGYPVLVGRSNGQLFAVSDICSHLGCSLSEGQLLGDRIRCQCHGSEFALEDGRVLKGPATAALEAFEVTPEDTGLNFTKK